MAKPKKYQWNRSDTGEGDEPVSRSQKKRESTALQRMGEALTALSPAVLKTLPLTETMITAVCEWQSISTFEGRRRQLQYIGRLMREEGDAEAIEQALAARASSHEVDTAAFRRIEVLREELMLAADTALDALLAPFGEEAQNLRQLVLSARNEKAHGRPPRDFRILFRRLKELSVPKQPKQVQE